MKKIITLLTIALFAFTVQAQTHKPVKKAATHTASASSTTTPAKAVVKPTPPPPPPAPPVVKPDEFSVLGKNYLNLGIGVGTYFNGTPFGAAFEHGFTDDISAGVFVNYSTYNNGDDFKTNIVYAGVRGSYHFAKLLDVENPRFDPYGGVSIGYTSVSFNGISGSYSSGILLGVHAGARYLFTPSVGAYAEVGYGVAALNLGVSFKF
jgi:hypothetical protein